ncbi:MAG: hypothetical protein AAB897_02610 [Patescibacteria group bacterium]
MYKPYEKRTDKEILAALERWLERVPRPDAKEINIGPRSSGKIFSPREIVEGVRKWIEINPNGIPDTKKLDPGAPDEEIIYNMYVRTHCRLCEWQKWDPVDVIDAICPVACTK